MCWDYRLSYTLNDQEVGAGQAEDEEMGPGRGREGFERGGRENPGTGSSMTERTLSVARGVHARRHLAL